MNREQVCNIGKWLMKHFFVMDIRNKDLIPEEGPYVVAVNHMSMIDLPLVLLDLFPRKDVYALAADKYKKSGILTWVLNKAEVIWINRETADFAAMKQARSTLREGHVLLIAPEGTRSKTESLNQGKGGVIMLTSQTKAPLYTLSVWGTEGFIKSYLHFRRPRVFMRYAPECECPDIDREHREESMRSAVDEVMCHLAAMLPEKYHGYYAGNARIEEIRSEWRGQYPGLVIAEG